MKMHIDKDLTTLAQEAKVRHDMREFRERYTDGDLLRAFYDATDINEAYSHDILSVSVKAFPAGSLFGDKTSFCVEMLTHGWRKFCEIRFYCDLDLEVDTRDLTNWRGESMGEKLYSCAVYERKEA